MAGSKRPTIEDVAREAGVSITTVSRYLNQRYEYMSAKTKAHIGQVIHRLDYRPNAMAQGLKANRTKLVAVIVVNISYPFCASVLRALSDVMAPAGFGLLVYDTGGDAEREREFLLSLRSQNVDGIIIQTNGANQDLLREFAQDVATVMVDRRFDIPDVTNVITDNEQASYQLTMELFQSGYKDVIYVTEPEAGISTREERLMGYRSACQAAGHNERIAWVDKTSPQTFRDFIEQMKSQTLRKPCAVYTANGLIMLELYPQLVALNLTVPTQLGLATFDDPDWASVTTPPLTSIRQPTEEMGRLAANVILGKVSDAANEHHQSVHTIPSQVIIRQSTMLS